MYHKNSHSVAAIPKIVQRMAAFVRPNVNDSECIYVCIRSAASVRLAAAAAATGACYASQSVRQTQELWNDGLSSEPPYVLRAAAARLPPDNIPRTPAAASPSEIMKRYCVARVCVYARVEHSAASECMCVCVCVREPMSNAS